MTFWSNCCFVCLVNVCFRAVFVHCEYSSWLGRNAGCLHFASSIGGATCRSDAASLALRISSTSSLQSVSIGRTYTNSKDLLVSLPPSAAPVYPHRSCNYSPHFITPTMPPKHSNLPPHPKHNGANTSVRINDGLAAKQRGEDPTGSWRIARNMTIRNPSQTMMTIGRATNTYIAYDNKFEFRFWGSLDNV